MVGSSGKAPIIWPWLTAFCAPASPVRSAELGSWSNGRSDPEPSRGSSGQPAACQSAEKNLSSKTARLACLNYLPRFLSAVTSTGLNYGIHDCTVTATFVPRSRSYQLSGKCPQWAFEPASRSRIVMGEQSSGRGWVKCRSRPQGSRRWASSYSLQC
jgi:hypothetical protein